jgi:hypothetical protein
VVPDCEDILLVVVPTFVFTCWAALHADAFCNRLLHGSTANTRDDDMGRQRTQACDRPCTGAKLTCDASAYPRSHLSLPSLALPNVPRFAAQTDSPFSSRHIDSHPRLLLCFLSHSLLLIQSSLTARYPCLPIPRLFITHHGFSTYVGRCSHAYRWLLIDFRANPHQAY